MTEEITKYALIVIDVQQGLFNKSTPVYQAKELLLKITGMVEKARRCGAAVVLVQHSDDKYLVFGSEAWQLHPRLQELEADLLMHKRHGNAFEETIWMKS